MLPTAAQASDIAQAEALLADRRPEVVIAGQGCDQAPLVAAIGARGAAAVIPTQRGREEQRVVDPHGYRERSLCERFRSRARRFRRVATRYGEKAANFLAFVGVAAVVVVSK